MLDPEVKKELDLKLVRGEITKDQYAETLSHLTDSSGSSSSKTRYEDLDTGFSVRVLPPGTILRGRYRILELLGRGGMGVVYRVTDLELGRSVALKVLPWEVGGNPDAYELFRREAQTAMTLRHENVMAVYGLDHDQETAFLVMEYVDGPTLSRLLLEQGRLKPDDVIGIGIQACDAMAYAHSKKTLHRDIKPQNIMMNGDGVLKVCDFGLAVHLRENLSRVSGRHVSGTVLYMAPEQYDGKGATFSSDIYSLGMTFYELLLGRHPWASAGNVEHLMRNVTPDPIPDVPRALNDLVMGMLQKNPSSRPGTFQELSNHFRRLAGSEIPGAKEDATNSFLNVSVWKLETNPPQVVPPVIPNATPLPPTVAAPPVTAPGSQRVTRTSTRSSPEEKVGASGVPWWIWALIGVVLTLVVVFLAQKMLSRPTVEIAGNSGQSSAPPSPTPIPFQPHKAYVHNVNGVNLRNGPSADHAAVGKVCYGEQVDVLESARSLTDPQHDFRRVQTAGNRQGWGYAGDNDEWFQRAMPAAMKKKDLDRVYQCCFNPAGYINVRARPHKDAPLVGVIRPGEQLRTIERVRSESDECSHYYAVRTASGAQGYAYFGPMDEWVR